MLLNTQGTTDWLFTVQHYASMVYAVTMCLSVHPSICMSIRHNQYVKMAKHRITETTKHNSPGTLVSKAKGLGKI